MVAGDATRRMILIDEDLREVLARPGSPATPADADHQGAE
jgi:hypothetical protein